MCSFPFVFKWPYIFFVHFKSLKFYGLAIVTFYVQERRFISEVNILNVAKQGWQHL